MTVYLFIYFDLVNRVRNIVGLGGNSTDILTHVFKSFQRSISCLKPQRAPLWEAGWVA